MHLRDGGGSQRLDIEARIGFGHRLFQLGFDQRLRLLAGEGRDLVLQEAEFVGDVRRQQVASRGQDLSELHEDRTEVLQCQLQSRAARHVGNLAARLGYEGLQDRQPARQRRVVEQGVEAIAQQHPQDAEDAQWQPHASVSVDALPGTRAASRLMWASRRSPSPRSLSTASLKSSISILCARSRLSSVR